MPVTLGGTVFLANSLLIDGLTFKCAIGLDVDEQQITLAARPTDTIGGVPALQAIHRGVLDGCLVRRERAFLTSWSAPPLGSVVLFQGRVTSVDAVGRTGATITVASDLVLLDIDMPAQPLPADMRPRALRFGLRPTAERLGRGRHGGRG